MQWQGQLRPVRRRQRPPPEPDQSDRHRGGWDHRELPRLVTNEGASPQTVRPRLVDLNPTATSTDTGHVALSAASPTYIDGEGNTDRYAVRTITVPAGADYLNGDIAWDAATTPTAAFETVFDPLGRVAAYSLLGTGHSGHGHIEVRRPTPGKWTAVIFTVSNAPYFGPVQFNYATERFHSTGSISPSSRTLAPGQTGTFHVNVTAGRAGDESLSLHFGTGGSDDGSIPITLRSLVPIGGGGGSFSGSLTGGGSTGNAGQSFTYQFRVPPGKPALNLGFRLADPGYQLTGYLVDPYRAAARRAVQRCGERWRRFRRLRFDDAVLPGIALERPVDGDAARQRTSRRNASERAVQRFDLVPRTEHSEQGQFPSRRAPSCRPAGR